MLLLFDETVKYLSLTNVFKKNNKHSEVLVMLLWFVLRFYDQQSILKAGSGSSTKVMTVWVKTMMEDTWNQFGFFIAPFAKTLMITVCWRLILIQDDIFVCYHDAMSINKSDIILAL